MVLKNVFSSFELRYYMRPIQYLYTELADSSFKAE